MTKPVKTEQPSGSATAPGRRLSRLSGKHRAGAGLAVALGVAATAFAAQSWPGSDATVSDASPIVLQAASDVVAAPAPNATPAAADEASAGQTVEVTSFGSNPGSLQMYMYVPVGLPRNAPLVVVMHGCDQPALTMDDETGWTTMADAYKFALVLPATNRTNDPNMGCFRSWDVNHNRRGVGESLSIKQMVDWMRKNHATDRSRVFATGYSSGAINTSVLLASYPDVFAAGAEMDGHPYRCSSNWDEFVACNLFSKSLTAQQWGDLVKTAYPGYKGEYPRMSIWHGSLDVIVNQQNAIELTKQWTNVHGIDDVPDTSDLVNGHQHFTYTDSAGTPKVERYLLTGVAHRIAVNPTGPFAPTCGAQTVYTQVSSICAVYYVSKWFGIAP